MDIELEFYDDKIESFLSEKLQEVLVHNISLEGVLKQRKDILKEPQRASGSISSLQVSSDVSKRIFNNKYCLMYQLQNNSSNIAKNLKIILYNDSNQKFDYKFEIFSVVDDPMCESSENCPYVTNSIIKSSSCERNGFLVVTFGVPHFLQKLELNVSGSILYNLGEQECTTLLPELQISPQDFNLSCLQVITSDLKNILTLLACHNEDNLVMILPEGWDSSLSRTFEIHCSFLELNMSSCKKFFVAYNISKLFDNSLIMVHANNNNTYFLNVYTTGNDQLLALLHHLSSSLSNVIILPQAYYQRHLCKNASFSNELLKEFNQSLLNELESCYKYIEHKPFNSNNDIVKLKETLCEVEEITDNLFVRVNSMKY